MAISFKGLEKLKEIKKKATHTLNTNSLFQQLTASTLATEGLVTGQTPLRMEGLENLNTIQGVPIDKDIKKPKGRENFFFVEPRRVNEVIEKQWKRYVDKPEKFGLTEDSTITDMVNVFDRTNPINKLEFLARQGVDLGIKIKDIKANKPSLKKSEERLLDIMQNPSYDEGTKMSFIEKMFAGKSFDKIAKDADAVGTPAEFKARRDEWIAIGKTVPSMIEGVKELTINQDYSVTGMAKRLDSVKKIAPAVGHVMNEFFWRPLTGGFQSVLNEIVHRELETEKYASGDASFQSLTRAAVRGTLGLENVSGKMILESAGLPPTEKYILEHPYLAAGQELWGAQLDVLPLPVLRPIANIKRGISQSRIDQVERVLDPVTKKAVAQKIKSLNLSKEVTSNPKWQEAANQLMKQAIADIPLPEGAEARTVGELLYKNPLKLTVHETAQFFKGQGGTAFIPGKTEFEALSLGAKIDPSKLAPAFVSKAAQLVTQKMAETATSEQVMGMLRNQVSEEELKWIGIEEYVKDKGKIKKEELLKHIQENIPVVDEVWKGAQIESPELKPLQAELKELGWETNKRAEGVVFREIGGEDDFWDWTEIENPVARKIARKISKVAEKKQISSTKYENYTLPEGENYRELLLQLDLDPKVLSEFMERMDNKYGEKWTDADLTPEENIEFRKSEIASSNEFKTSHWNEPNIVASIRMNDRLTPDGKKVLFIEEIQSDWARELRTEKKFVPEAPFLKNWHEYALKKMIRYAAENGYDSIAWTTGKQQVDRYSLVKQVTTLVADKVNGKYKINVQPVGQAQYVEIGIFSSNDLPNYVGKDMSKKITESNKSHQVYYPKDLEIGGESLKTLYDKMIPQFLNKYTRKVGGGLGQVNLGTTKKTPLTDLKASEMIDNEEAVYYNTNDGKLVRVEDTRHLDELIDQDIPVFIKKENLKQPSLLLTDKLKKAVLTQSQELFSRTPPDPEEIAGQGPVFRIDADTTILNSSGNKVTLPKGEEYTAFPLKSGRIRLQDGKKVTIFEGELKKLNGKLIDTPGDIKAGGIIPRELPEILRDEINARIRKEGATTDLKAVENLEPYIASKIIEFWRTGERPKTFPTIADRIAFEIATEFEALKNISPDKVELDKAMYLNFENTAFEKHLDYIEGFQIPRSSKVWKIKKEMRATKSKISAGTIAKTKGRKALRQLNKELKRAAVNEGMVFRKTRGGKQILALRQAGTYVPPDFNNYPDFKNVRAIAGGGTDITRTIQGIDGALTVAKKKLLPGQAGPTERYILWRTRDMMMSKLEWLNKQGIILQEVLTGVQPNSMEDQLLTRLVRQISTSDAFKPAIEMFDVGEVSGILRGLPEGRQLQLIEIAQKGRRFYDDLLDMQNEVRQMMNIKPIPRLEFYSPEQIRESNIWSKVSNIQKRVSQVMDAKAPLPDFVKPNAPFNPREQARQHGIPWEEQEMRFSKLMSDYVVTASKDIFNTPIIQNNKVFIEQFRSKGLDQSSATLNNWTAEAFAGVSPTLDRYINPPGAIKGAARKFNQARNLGVFAFNYGWSLVTQIQSAAQTVGRYGLGNTLRGTIDWLSNPAYREKAAQEYYSFIMKSQRSGRVAQQDIQNLMGSKVPIYRTPLDIFENIGYFFIHEFEKILTGASIRAAEIYGKGKGLKGEALTQFASDGGGKTQSMYNDEDRPGVLRSLAIKTAAPYQTYAFEMVNTLREWSGQTGTPPDTVTQRIWSVVRWLAATAVLQTYAFKLSKRKFWTYDLKTIPIPFTEFWLSPVIGDITDSPQFYGRNLPSPVQFANETANGIKDVIKYGSWRKLRANMLRYGPGFFGIGGGAMFSRLTDSSIAYAQGGYRSKKTGKLLRPVIDHWDWIRATIFGPNSIRKKEKSRFKTRRKRFGDKEHSEFKTRRRRFQ